MDRPAKNPPVKVLIVDDSAVIRTLLTHILQSDPAIEVVGAAIDAFDARKKLIELKPDVMTLDIEMPRMDGLTFLEKLMEHYPTPTVVISTLASKSSEASLRALELGAFAAIEKPVITSGRAMEAVAATIRSAVKAAKSANLSALRQSARLTKAACNDRTRPLPPLASSERFILAIGASTGGTEAIKTVLLGLPADIPPLVIVQHMPPTFTHHYAGRLNGLVRFAVKEAEDGDELRSGLALLAPGDFHMKIVAETSGKWRVRLNKDPQLHAVRPAVDIMMQSVAQTAGSQALGVILTGMGKDGAAGLKAMRDAGARTIAQDEASSVVYGMPRAAFELGAVEKVVALKNVAEELVAMLRQRRRAG